MQSCLWEFSGRSGPEPNKLKFEEKKGQKAIVINVKIDFHHKGISQRIIVWEHEGRENLMERSFMYVFVIIGRIEN